MLAEVVASGELVGVSNSTRHQAPSSGLSATFSPEAVEKGQGEGSPSTDDRASSSGLTAPFSPEAAEKGKGGREEGRLEVCLTEVENESFWLVPIEDR